MKHYLIFMLWFTMASGFTSCVSKLKSSHQTIILTNTASVALADKPVTLARQDLKIPEAARYPLLISQTGDTIPSQLDDMDGDKIWDELFFVANLSSRQTDTIHLNWVDSEPDYTKRTSIRFGVRQHLNSKLSQR